MSREDFPDWNKTPGGSFHWLLWWESAMDAPELAEVYEWCFLVDQP